MSRTTVRLLYKTKLSLCKRMGYQYGNWNSNRVFDNNKIGKRQIEKLTRQTLLGDYVWNTIRNNYKNFIHVDNKHIKEELIDQGFANLRHVNLIYSSFKRDPSNLLNDPLNLLPYK